MLENGSPVLAVLHTIHAWKAMVTRAPRTPAHRGTGLLSMLAVGLAVSLAATAVSAQPERTGIHKSIPPLRSTFDTLGFFPPAGNSPFAGAATGRLVQNVAVLIDTLNFPLDEALEIVIHHGRCADTLVHGLRTGGANFRRAVFVDSARVAADTGAAPFTGQFSPARPLAQFDGGEASGLWVLEIYNNSVDRMGVLEQWGVAINFSLALTSAQAGGPGSVRAFALSQNYPNPFNPSTVIPYTLPERSDVSLALFNTLGELVMTIANGEEGPGAHEARLDASRLSSGVYFYRLQAGNHVAVKSLVVVK